MSEKLAERFVANGETTLFTFNFSVPDSSWVGVQELLPNATEMTSATGYKVELYHSSGNVVFYNPPQKGTIITIFPHQPVQPILPLSAPGSSSQATLAACEDVLNSLIHEGTKLRSEFNEVYEKCLNAVPEVNKAERESLNRLESTTQSSEEIIKSLMAEHTALWDTLKANTTDAIATALQDAQIMLAANNAQQDKVRVKALDDFKALANTASVSLSQLHDKADKTITEKLTQSTVKLTELYQQKYNELAAFKAQLNELPIKTKEEAATKAAATYAVFQGKVDSTADEIQVALQQAVKDIQATTKDALEQIRLNGEEVCKELDNVTAAYSTKLDEKFANASEQIKKCIIQACEFASDAAKQKELAVEAANKALEYKELAYSAAGNKGWLVYRVLMPKTQDDITKLQNILNDGGLVIAAGDDPEDGGGNPTGGTDTQDFWCMVKAVQTYQEVVEKLLADLTPGDLEEIHSFSEIVKQVLDKLDYIEGQFETFHLTHASLKEQIVRNMHAIFLMYQILGFHDEKFKEVENAIADLANLVDKKVSDTLDGANQVFRELQQEHNRLAYLIDRLTKRIEALEQKNRRR